MAATATSATANASRLTFAMPALNVPWRVVGFEAQQALSELGQCELELACERSDLPLTDLLGKAGVLAIADPSGPMYWHGEVAVAELGEVGRRFTRYRLTLRPRLWLLSLRSGLRIFQNMNVPDIVQQVLRDAGFASDDVQWRLKQSFAPRSYCTQYRETDLAFVQRLLAEEGLFYWIEHQRNHHVLTIADHNGALQPIDGDPVLPLRPAGGMVTTQQAILDFHLQRSLASSAVALRDFHWEKPALQLEQSVRAPGRGDALQIYDYPGLFQNPEEGRWRAQLELKRQQVLSQLASGSSDSPRLQCGRRFTLKEHPSNACNGEYSLIGAHLSGRQPQSLEEDATAEGSSFRLKFRAMPVSIPCCPLQRFPRPRIEGVQTAFVTGPAGEEIYTDAAGRVKVQFHWDREGRRDEHSSCWLRVRQAWAGNRWGSLVLPRVGQEVLVTFVNGDPDQPLVTGTFYNATSIPPYSLPEHKTRSSFKSRSSPGGDGFNEIRIEDRKGREQLFVHAERDATFHISNDWRESIGNEAHRIVQASSFEQTGLERHLTIGANLNVSTGGNLSHQVKGDSQLDVSGSSYSSGGNELHFSSGNDLILDAGQSLTLRAGGASILLGPAGVAINGRKVRINSGGDARAARAASQAAIQPPRRVRPGQPGNTTSIGLANARFQRRPIAFSESAVKTASAVATETVTAPVTPSSGSPASGADVTSKPALHAVADQTRAAIPLSDAIPPASAAALFDGLGDRKNLSSVELSALGDWVKETGSALADTTVIPESMTTAFDSLTETATILQQQADVLKSSAENMLDDARRQADSLLEQGEALLHDAKQTMLDAVHDTLDDILDDILPEALQDLLGLSDDEFDFSD